MNGVLGQLCADKSQTGPGEHPEDGVMNEMTLPSRHKIRALAVRGRAHYLSVTEVTEAPHNIYEWAGGQSVLYIWTILNW